MAGHDDHSEVETPRAAPEIISPSDRGRDLRSDMTQQDAYGAHGFYGSYANIRLVRLAPWQVFAALILVVVVMAVLVFLFASAFIFVAAFVGIFIVFSVVMAYVRGFFRA
jgi:uncharacterized membrane protein